MKHAYDYSTITTTTTTTACKNEKLRETKEAKKVQLKDKSSVHIRLNAKNKHR